MSSAAPPTPTPSSRAAPDSSTARAADTRNGESGPESLSELEREVLGEYEQLLANLNELSPLLSSLSTNPTAQVLDTLRVLERKASLVSTLLKASVYSIVLQQEMLEEDHGGGAGGEGSGAEIGHGEEAPSWVGSE